MSDQFQTWDVQSREYGSGSAFVSIGSVAAGGPYVYDDGRAIPASGYEYRLGQTTANGVVVPYNNVSIGGAPYVYGYVASMGEKTKDLAFFTNGGVDYLYAATRPFGLVVVDVTNPSAPVILPTPFTPVDAGAISVFGNRAGLYGDQNLNGIRIFDITNPARPIEKGFIAGPFNDVHLVSQSLLYASAGISGMVVIDISNPDSPVQIGSYNSPGIGRSIRNSGVYGYLCDGPSGLQVVNVTAPTNPTLVRTISTGGDTFCATVKGSRLYLGVNNVGMIVYDISDPSFPQLLTTTTLTNPLRVAINSNSTKAFVASGNGGWYIVDLTQNPPVVLSQTAGSTEQVIPPGDGGGYYGAYLSGIAVSGNTVFTAQGARGIQVYDSTNPASPVYLSSKARTTGALEVKISGSLAVSVVSIASSDPPRTGLRSFDISNPAAPVLLGSLDGPSTSYFYQRVAISNGYVYATAGSVGIVTSSLAQNGTLVQLNVLDTSGYTQDVKVYGAYAYVADAGGGIQVLSLSNPAAPSTVANVPIRTGSTVVRGLSISGTSLYVSVGDGNNSRLEIYNISSPIAPAFLGSLNLTGNSYGYLDVDATLQRVYFVTSFSVYIVGVSNPVAPNIIGNISVDYYSGRYFDGVLAAGTKLYISDRTGQSFSGAGIGQVVIYDVANAQSPVLLNTVKCYGRIQNIVSTATNVYVADDVSTMNIIHP